MGNEQRGVDEVLGGDIINVVFVFFRLYFLVYVRSHALLLHSVSITGNTEQLGATLLWGVSRGLRTPSIKKILPLTNHPSNISKGGKIFWVAPNCPRLPYYASCHLKKFF